MPEFKAANLLEQTLLDAQLGKTPSSVFFNVLHDAQVYILLNQPLDEEGAWVEGTEPLVLQSEAGAAVIAAFTSPERADMWRDIARAYCHGEIVDFLWVLRGAVNDVGIALNPGSEVGLELSAEMVQRMRDTA